MWRIGMTGTCSRRANVPAKSQAQRAYLNAHFGHKWVKAHHFDNRGKLPKHALAEAAKKR